MSKPLVAFFNVISLISYPGQSCLLLTIYHPGYRSAVNHIPLMSGFCDYLHDKNYSNLQETIKSKMHFQYTDFNFNRTFPLHVLITHYFYTTNAELMFAICASHRLVLNCTSGFNENSPSTSVFANTTCIPNSWWCDWIVNCSDGSDEDVCPCKSIINCMK